MAGMTKGWFAATVLLIAAGAGSLTANVDSADEQFIAESRVVMGKMMTAMEVAPSGDVDADFVAMMIPHHAGAIEMAQAELRAGRCRGARTPRRR
jgi:uncharacterized protein (DUF305 family)